jgi:hypothetical protein
VNPSLSSQLDDPIATPISKVAKVENNASSSNTKNMDISPNMNESSSPF